MKFRATFSIIMSLSIILPATSFAGARPNPKQPKKVVDSIPDPQYKINSAAADKYGVAIPSGTFDKTNGGPWTPVLLFGEQAPSRDPNAIVDTLVEKFIAASTDEKIYVLRKIETIQKYRICMPKDDQAILDVMSARLAQVSTASFSHIYGVFLSAVSTRQEMLALASTVLSRPVNNLPLRHLSLTASLDGSGDSSTANNQPPITQE